MVVPPSSINKLLSNDVIPGKEFSLYNLTFPTISPSNDRLNPGGKEPLINKYFILASATVLVASNFKWLVRFAFNVHNADAVFHVSVLSTSPNTLTVNVFVAVG